VILQAVGEALGAGARLNAACRLVGVSARTVERWRTRPDGDDLRFGPRQRPQNALTPAEEAQVVNVMTSARYGALSPKQLVPRLADEGLYLASESTMYRLQRRLGLRERKRLITRTHVTRASTVHLAAQPNQVWSWDITWLPTVVRGCYVYLYLVMDVWSRRIVGWTVEARETADAAAALIQRACRDGDVDPHGLVLHSDNGKPMRGSTMLATLQWLGVVPSFSRPHVSDDNPYSEALFRTLKHTPAYPRLPFADAEAGRRWVARFVAWYNREHRHSAIRYVTPDERHFGRETQVLSRRRELYARARRSNPERWSRTTRNWQPVGTVTLNPEPRASARPMEATCGRAQSESRAAQPARAASETLPRSSTPAPSGIGRAQ
jgi:putative transposase